MKFYYLIILLLLISCAVDNMSKIKFDLSELDHRGLIGPKDGKVSLAYEFCIPANNMSKDLIREIDPTIQFSNSPGRISCRENQYLCVGETNVQFNSIFKQLTELEFIKSIERCYFE